MRLIFAALLLTVFCGAAWAGDLLIVGDDDFPPYSYENDHNEIVGIDVDIVREMARRLNLGITIKLVPWKRLIKMTQSGACDAGFSLFLTDERKAFADFALARPVHVSRFPVFYKKGTGLRFSTIEDLFGKTIGVNRGFVISDDFDAAVHSGRITIHLENNVDRNIMLTALGRIDAFTNNFAVTWYKLTHDSELRRFRDQIAVSQQSIEQSRNAYFVLSKKAGNIDDNKAMLRKINRTLSGMDRDGFYRQAQERYLSDPAREKGADHE